MVVDDDDGCGVVLVAGAGADVSADEGGGALDAAGGVVGADVALEVQAARVRVAIDATASRRI